MDGKRGRRGLPRPGRTRSDEDARPREAAAPGAVPEARRRGLPAQAHVVALAAAVLLPLALAAAALLWRAAEAERDRSRQDALGLARRLAADVDRELDGVVLTLQALATSPALQAGDLVAFAAQARAVPGFRGGEVVLSDRAGRPLVSAGAPEAPLPASTPAELGEAAAAVFASGAPLVSDLPAETASGRFLLLVEVPARRDGAVAFALGVTLPPARLSEALAADLPAPAWTAAVIDRQGRIVVRSREAARPVAGLAPEDARRDTTEPEGLRAGAAPDGTPVLVAYARPRLAPWRVEDEVPAALVEAPLRRLWWLLAGMAPVLGLATAAAGWWGGRLSREVRRLAAAAAAIERGEPVRPVASPMREINGIGEALAVAAAERATAEAALRESERRFRDFAEAGSDWFWETDAEHRFVWQSANVGRTSGVPAEWAYGKTRLEIAAPGTDPAALEAHRRTLEAHRPFRDFEYLRRGPLGDVWLSTSGVPVFDEAGRLAGYRGIGRDITATKRAEEQVQRLAHHDALTGLPNRVLFRDRFGQALALAGRGGGRLAVLLLDLDDFKGVNDTLGHPTGDALLRGIAGRLGGLVRGGDTLARLGGDEFALVQVGARQPADAAALAARLLAALEAPFALDGRAVHVAASMGIALYPEDGADPDELLKNCCHEGPRDRRHAGRLRHRRPGQSERPADRRSPRAPARARARQSRWVVVFSNDAHDPSDPELRVWGDHALAGTPGAQVISELEPRARPARDRLSQTRVRGLRRHPAQRLLRALGVDEVVICGQHAHICVRHSSYGVLIRGYRVTIPRDGVCAFDGVDVEAALDYLVMATAPS